MPKPYTTCKGNTAMPKPYTTCKGNTAMPKPYTTVEPDAGPGMVAGDPSAYGCG